MLEEPVRLRPIEEADLDPLRRFDIDPSSKGPYLSSIFRSPQIRPRRWEEDGWLGDDFAQLAVALPDGTLAGIVSWRSIQTGGPDGGCLDIGALLFPEYLGRGLGPQRNDPANEIGRMPWSRLTVATGSGRLGGGVPCGLGEKKGQEPAQGMMRLRGNRLEL
jgi:hypothetical protein